MLLVKIIMRPLVVIDPTWKLWKKILGFSDECIKRSWITLRKYSTVIRFRSSLRTLSEYSAGVHIKNHCASRFIYFKQHNYQQPILASKCMHLTIKTFLACIIHWTKLQFSLIRDNSMEIFAFSFWTQSNHLRGNSFASEIINVR